jgi:hypothetical protein
VDFAIALARCLFETSTVSHDNLSSTLLDQAGGLEAPQSRTDRGALDPEHFCQKFMGQGQGVLIQAVMRAEEPAAASGLNRVHGIAGYGVIRLGEQCFVLGEHQSL